MRNGSFLPTTWKTNSLFNDFDSLFSMFPDLRPESELNLNKVGAVDIEETDKSFLLNIDVPGFSKEQIKIEVMGDRLTIRAEKNESNEAGKKYHLRERSFAAFERSFRLGELVDLEKISARYEQGVLTLEIPKREATKQRTINIS